MADEDHSERPEVKVSRANATKKTAKARAKAKKGGSRKTTELTLDERLAKAFAHPLRARIVSMLNERGRAMSASELEAPLGERVTNISYHMRKLYEYGCVEPADREQVRGAMKTRYRSVTRMLLTDDNWATLSAESKAGVSFAAVSEAFDRASTAIEAKTMDSRPNRHIITMKPDLDEEGWQKAAALLEATFEGLEEIEAEVANRTPKPEERFKATISILSYESPVPTP